MEKTDNSSFDIVQCKVFADGEKYFLLFDRYIPTLGSGQTVLLYSIDNIDCISRIVKKNPEASYVVYGDRFVNACVKSMFPSVETIDSDFENRKTYNIDMKFDCVIMNPPYEKNLHLKILAEAIKHLKDDNSRVVNLSPIRWLQDPLAQYKKSNYKRYEESISKHLIDLNIIDNITANNMFNIAILFNLGIYSCCKNAGCFDYASVSNVRFDTDISWMNRIFSTILQLNGFNKAKVQKYSTNVKHFVALNNMAPPMKYGNPMFDTLKRFCGYFCNGLNDKHETYIMAKNNCHRIVNGDISQDNIVVFETADESKNCFNSFMQTNFARFVCMMSVTDVHMHQEFLPWMGDCVNPRTGKKGYESEWTDEDFYTFFNITPEEQKIIEETMAKYAK